MPTHYIPMNVIPITMALNISYVGSTSVIKYILHKRILIITKIDLINYVS